MQRRHRAQPPRRRRARAGARRAACSRPDRDSRDTARSASAGRSSAGVPRGLLLPAVPLPLIEVAPAQRRDQLLRAPEVVAVVGLVASGQRHARRVMEVVVPHAVQAVAAVVGGARRGARPAARARRRSDVARPRAAARTRRPIAARTCSGDVVVDGVGGVEAQAVEVELVDPVAGVGDEELAHRARARAVEVQRLAPFVACRSR